MFDEKTQKIVETDVLVVGGGLGGCMTAIKASESGAKVTIVEKTTLRRSGGGVLGLGRTLLIHPDYNVSFKEFAKQNVESSGGIINEDLPYTVARESLDRVKDLESWHINMRGKDGKYSFKDAPDIVPIPNIVARVFAGTDLQPLLAEEVMRRNINVIERTTVTKLLVESRESGGKVVGAIAVNARDGTFYIIKAKSICLCSGGCYRLYRRKNSSYAPDRLMKVMAPKVGEGLVVAYQAGAELVNCEFAEGPEVSLKDFFAHGYNWTPWALGPYDASGNTLPRPLSLWEAMRTALVEGKGSIFYYLRGIPTETRKRMEELEPWVAEKFANDLYTKSRPLNIWEEPIEYEVRPEAYLHGGQAGVCIDTEAKTNIKGLYAAGDTTGGGLKYSSMGAWVFGARAGKNAAEYARTAPDSDVDISQIEAEKERVFAAAKQKEGYEWFELEDKVRQIVTDYASFMRSEGKLKRGLERLEHIKNKYLPLIVARSPRELMHCLEVQCLFTVAELHMQAALFRKESRFLPSSFHFRIDYPERDDKNWSKLSVIRNVAGKIQLTARDPVRL